MHKRVAVVPVQTQQGWMYQDGSVIDAEGLKVFLVAFNDLSKKIAYIAIFDVETGSLIDEVNLIPEDIPIINKTGGLTENTWARVCLKITGISMWYKARNSKDVKEARLQELNRMKDDRPPIFYLDKDDPKLYEKIKRIKNQNLNL